MTELFYIIFDQIETSASLLPWLLGASSGLLVAKSLRYKICHAVVISTSTGLIAAILFPLLVLVEHARSIFHLILIASCALVVLLITRLGWLYRSDFSHGAKGIVFLIRGSPISSFLIFLSVLTVGAHMSMADAAPVFGWDVLDYWGPYAVDMIASWTNGTSPNIALPRLVHPKTVSAFIAWPAAVSQSSAAGLNLWNIIFLGNAGLVYCFTRILTGNVEISLLTTLFYLTTPLISNHALIPGYAEIFILACVLSASALLTLACTERDFLLFVLGLLLLSCCLLLKNIGWVYVLCALMGCISCFLITTLKEHLWWAFSFLILLLLVAGLLLLFSSPQPISVHQFWIGNRLVLISFQDVFLIARNISHALFVNTSFSIYPLAALILIFCVVTQRFTSFIYLPLHVSFFIFLILFFSQFTNLGFNAATPDKDTGYSRFSMMYICNLFLLMPALLHGMFRKDRVVSRESD